MNKQTRRNDKISCFAPQAMTPMFDNQFQYEFSSFAVSHQLHGSTTIDDQ